MSIWEAFGMGRYKGFSREAGLLLDEAVELAGGGHPGAAGPACHPAAAGQPGRAAAAGRGTQRPGAASRPSCDGSGPAPRHGLCSHWGAERPPVPRRTGTPALRHAGRRRLRRRGHAGFDGCPAHRGGAGVPPAFGAVHPAHPAPDVPASAAREPGQRQILPRPDPPGGGR